MDGRRTHQGEPSTERSNGPRGTRGSEVNSLEIKYINKDNAEFTRTKDGFVALDFDGKHYDRVAVYRSFPFTDPDKYISIREPDAHAEEIGIIQNIDDIGTDAASLLISQINLRYFTPKIIKIKNISDKYGYAYFDVDTDRGECKFTIRVGGGAVARLSDIRLIFSDIDGNRFEIEDVTKLAPKEQKKIDVYI